MSDLQRTDFPAFTEHRVQRDRGSLYVRDFPERGAAFVLLHGFPDNSHIYDDLIPHLASAGRRTISIDFLGFGASDKLDGAHYGFEQQLRDLEAVVKALGLEEDHPGRPRCRWPDRRQLRSEAPGTRGRRLLDERVLRRRPWTTSSRVYRALRKQKPEISHPAFLGEIRSSSRGCSLFSATKMQVGLTEAQKAHYTQFLGPIVDNNFSQRPSAGPGLCPNPQSILG